MTAALLYDPMPRWRIGVAFAAAALIHLSAIALAGRMMSETTSVEIFTDDWIDVSGIPGPQDSPPPADPEQILTPSPAPPSADDFTADEKQPPVPVVKRRSVAKPLVRAVAQSSAPIGKSGSAKVLASHAPKLEYPYEARRQHLTGSGVALLIVDISTGSVTDVKMSQSTGNALLDNAARAGFRRWRFKPGTVSQVQTPITFTLTGAAY